MNKIESRYNNYQYLFKKFTKKKINERIYYMTEMYNQFIEVQSSDVRQLIRLDENLLGNAIMDYFADLYRLKQFHNIETANYDKVFSYEVYWLLKRKPIQVISNDSKTDLSFINEKFLTTYFLSHIFNGFEDIIKNQKDDYYSAYINCLLYNFKFREVTPQALEMLALSVKIGMYSICKQNNIDFSRYEE